MPKTNLTQELQDALKDIVKQCEDEDSFIRRAQVKTWKKYEEFWHGVQYLFWNERGQTWISPQSGAAPNLGFSNEEMEEIGPFYDFVIDIFSAHGQSIISALSAQLPSVKFVPDDGTNDSDCDTAKTFDKIADLVARHNNEKLMFIKSLFFLWINGFVASYHYVDTDSKYGTYSVPIFENKEIVTLSCPNCGEMLGNLEEDNENNKDNKENKESEASEDSEENKDLEESLEDNEKTDETAEDTSSKKQGDEKDSTSPEQICPNCGQEIVPEKGQSQIIPLQVGDEDKPKSRIKHEIYGSLFVKVPIYAFNQAGCGYCGLYLDKPKDELIAALCYDGDKLDEDLSKKIESEYMINDDRWARNEYQYPAGTDIEQRPMTTLLQYWLRPSKFNLHKNYEMRKKLLKKFPKGCKYVAVGKNKVFINAVEEELDRRWTFGKAGLSTYIHADPLCRPLVPIQEMRNQLDNLIMDTIEHGIPSTFADSEVLDFDAYGKFEPLPGYMFKAKPRPGKTLGESFYTEQKASVPREVGSYRQMLDKDAQFTVGSFPSLYGGPSEGKSRTLGEYQQSRQQALQRLTLTWIHVADFYRRDMEQMSRMYAEMMIEDEHFTRIENGNYITVWIRKSQMQGKVGGVESEVSDAFPMTLQQKQMFLQKFIELNNPQINAALYAPENRKIIQGIFMMNELKMPGANQIYKQVVEINEMLKNQNQGPIGPGISSVPIDPVVDDDAIHIAACKDFLVDDIGLDLKKQQPNVYADIIAHLMMHEKNLQLKTMTQFESSSPGQPPDTSETSQAGGDE
jgi:predicted RNA-binding Zn-ribbon protein involved in translation (DUF1610 family)